jgi:hypothetical protein
MGEREAAHTGAPRRRASSPSSAPAAQRTRTSGSCVQVGVGERGRLRQIGQQSAREPGGRVGGEQGSARWLACSLLTASRCMV